MRIVSIDPGLRNMGFAIINDGVLVDFGSICIWDLVPKNKHSDYPFIARVLVDNTDIFTDVDIVLIERQMQSRMKMIACSLRCFFWEKSHMVAPLSVRKYFNISTGVYKNNKKASIELVPKYLSIAQIDKFKQSKKKDDMADSILQGLYWCKIKK